MEAGSSQEQLFTQEGFLEEDGSFKASAEKAVPEDVWSPAPPQPLMRAFRLCPFLEGLLPALLGLPIFASSVQCLKARSVETTVGSEAGFSTSSTLCAVCSVGPRGPFGLCFLPSCHCLSFALSRGLVLMAQSDQTLPGLEALKAEQQ